MGREFIGQNCDKDEIVDAENNFQHHQGHETYPGIGVGNPVHGPIHDVSAPVRAHPEKCEAVFGQDAR
ncbi:hypothetical protein [Brucella rhizosphaerae]|uniref:hypothetical protein n=1 Tax=Brucella rhizosphaerae TaxID=571254 RepID=UPI003614BEE7